MSEFEYQLLPTQQNLFEIPHDETLDAALYQGGLGSGKTTAGALLGFLLTQKYPGSIGLVCAYTHTLLRDTTREKWVEIVPASMIHSWTQGGNERLILTNGSQVWFRPGKEFTRIQSTEFHWIHIDEAGQFPKKKPFDHLLGRLRKPPRDGWPDYRRRIFLTGNPQEDVGWIHDTFIEPEVEQPGFRYMIASTAENYLLHDAENYVDTLRGQFDSEAARVYIDGLTGSTHKGLVYRSFDVDENVSKELEYDRRLPLCISFDFNVAFMCPIVIQYDERADIVRVIDEVPLEWGDTEQICDMIIDRWSSHRGELHVYGDPAGYDTRSNSRVSDWDVIKAKLGKRFDLYVRVSRKDSGDKAFMIRNRTRAVNALFCDAHGRRRLMIASKCVNLIRGLRGVKWDTAREFQKVKVKDPSDSKFKLDHPTDELDYYVYKEHKTYGKMFLQFG